MIIMGSIMKNKTVPTAMLLFSLSGCVSASVNSDLRRIRELTHFEHFAALENSAIDSTTPDDARAILREPLTADAAVRVAMLNNRSVRAQLRELGIARGQLLQAGILPNPTVEVEALPERNSLYEFRLEYDITSLIFAPLQAKASTADLEAARYRAASAVVQLAYDVRSAFYALQAAEQQLAVSQRALDAFAAGRDAAVSLFEAGNIPAFESSSQIAAYERARISVAQIELELAERRETMQRLLGLHGKDTEWTLQKALPTVPEKITLPENPETRALEANLDLASTRSQLEAIAQRTGLARLGGWLPEIALDVHSLYSRPEDIPASDNDEPWRFGGGISLSIPIFDRKQGTASAYAAEFDGLLERYHGMAVDLRSAVRDARNRLVSAHARARQFQQVIVPAQQAVMEQTLLQYNAMQIGVFQLLQARRDQLDIELSYVETLREYWSASAAVDALLAGGRGQRAQGESTPLMSSSTSDAGDH